MRRISCRFYDFRWIILYIPYIIYWPKQLITDIEICFFLLVYVRKGNSIEQIQSRARSRMCMHAVLTKKTKMGVHLPKKITFATPPPPLA